MGGKTPSTHAANLLASLSQQIFRESDPARRQFFQQLNEAMQTGGVGARIPIIQRAVEAQNAANAGGLQKTSENLTRAGLAGSPFATNILANQTAGGMRSTADIGPEFAQALISGAPSAVTSATGIPGLASAASLQQSAQMAGLNAESGNVGAGSEAAGSIVASLISKGGLLNQ